MAPGWFFDENVLVDFLIVEHSSLYPTFNCRCCQVSSVTFHFVNCPFGQSCILTTAFFQFSISSTFHAIKFPFNQFTISSIFHVIKSPYCQLLKKTQLTQPKLTLRIHNPQFYLAPYRSLWWLTKWQVGKMASWQNDEVPPNPFVQDQCYKTFFVCNLLIFVISCSVCPWQAFLVLF